MFALILEAGYEQRTSHNVRTLWGALDGQTNETIGRCGREAAASERSEPHARSAGPTRLNTTQNTHSKPHITQTKHRHRTQTKNRHRSQTKNRHRTQPKNRHITYAINEQRTVIMFALMLEAGYEQ